MADSEMTPADEPAHDVLAAEEFAMPAPDPPHAIPADPAGIPEPHDVLAAEEYPLGGGGPAGGSLVRHPDGGIRRGVLLGALALAALLALKRLKARGRS